MINAAGNSDDKIYIQRARLDGSTHNGNYLQHSDIKAGGELDLIMNEMPSAWGSGSKNGPSSVSVLSGS